MWHFLSNPITWLWLIALANFLRLHSKQKQIDQLRGAYNDLSTTVKIQTKAILELRDDILNNTRAINHNAELTNDINKIVVNKLHDIDQRRGD